MVNFAPRPTEFEVPYFDARETYDQSLETAITDASVTANSALDAGTRALPTRGFLPAETPAGFAWQDHPLQGKLFTDGRNFVTDFDVGEFAPTGKTYYADAVNGANSNDGLTPETAVKSLYTARTLPDCSVIIAAEGGYHRAIGFGLGSNPTLRDVTLKAAPGAHVTVGPWDTVNWTKTPGHTNTYQSARHSADRVGDTAIVDQNGDYFMHTNVGGIAEVDATPGSWYTDGPNLYIRTKDGKTPGNGIRVYIKERNVVVGTGVTFYAENIHFEGGVRGCVGYGEGSNIYLKNCSLKYTGTDAAGALQTVGANLVISQGVTAAKSQRDGFNYHSTAGAPVPKFIEIDCVGRDVGVAASDQCSTSHGGSVGIRVNGLYRNSVGQNIADVNPGTETWNLGSVAYGTEYGGAWYSGDGAKMWLDHCEGYAAPFGLYLNTEGEAYIRQCQFAGTHGTPANY